LAVDSRGSLALTYGSVLDSRGRESPRKAFVEAAIAVVGAIAFVAIQQRKRSVVRPQAYIEPERPAVMPITVLTTQPGAKADKVVPWEHRSP
jgi:hypothetical protein